MMTFALAEHIIENIQYRDWTIVTFRPRFDDGHMVLGFTFHWRAPDATGGVYPQRLIDMHSTGHFISSFMDETQVLRRVYHAIRIAEEHEAREFFRYRDTIIFDPHKPNTL